MERSIQMKRQMVAGCLAVILIAGTGMACESSNRILNSNQEFTGIAEADLSGDGRLPGLVASGNIRNVSNTLDDDRITATGAVTAAADSGELLLAYGADEPLAADTLLFLDVLAAACELPPAEEILLTAEMLSGTEDMYGAGLQAGDQITVQELIAAAVIGGYRDAWTVLNVLCGSDVPADQDAGTVCDLVLRFRDAVNRDEFLQMSGEAWHELSWQRADGTKVSFGITSKSSSMAASVLPDSGCEEIGGILIQTETDGLCWLLYYREADGAGKISAVAGLSDTVPLTEQMQILLDY